jgi:NAD(P)-dependent dehydrogenase (short-subunit alcohol dehydrogenase family)
LSNQRHSDSWFGLVYESLAQLKSLLGSMVMILNGKVAIVTGGTSGMGQATAIALAKQGAKVLVAGRRTEEGEKTIAQIQAVGGEGIFHKTDVTQVSDVQAMVQKAVDTFGHLDIAFNNAGFHGKFGMLADTSEEDFYQAFDINFKGVYLSMKYEIKQMMAQGTGGAIVNTSSVSGVRTMAGGLAAYVTSKHAVIALTKCAAVEYAQAKIRVNTIAPGGILTDMLRTVSGGNTDAMAQYNPMKRLGEPDEIANAVIWLCSDASSYVTGHTLAVDGGLLAL